MGNEADAPSSRREWEVFKLVGLSLSAQYSAQFKLLISSFSDDYDNHAGLFNVGSTCKGLFLRTSPCRLKWRPEIVLSLRLGLEPSNT